MAQRLCSHLACRASAMAASKAWLEMRLLFSKGSSVIGDVLWLANHASIARRS